MHDDTAEHVVILETQKLSRGGIHSDAAKYGPASSGIPLPGSLMQDTPGYWRKDLVKTICCFLPAPFFLAASAEGATDLRTVFGEGKCNIVGRIFRFQSCLVSLLLQDDRPLFLPGFRIQPCQKNLFPIFFLYDRCQKNGSIGGQRPGFGRSAGRKVFRPDLCPVFQGQSDNGPPASADHKVFLFCGEEGWLRCPGFLVTHEGTLPLEVPAFDADAADYTGPVHDKEQASVFCHLHDFYIRILFIEDPAALFFILVGSQCFVQKGIRPVVIKLPAFLPQQRIQSLPQGAFLIIVLQKRKSVVYIDGRKLSLQFPALPGDLDIFGNGHAQKNSQNGGRQGHQAQKAHHPVPPFPLPERIERTPKKGCIDPDDLFFKGLPVNGMVPAGNVGSKGLCVSRDISLFVEGMEKVGRKRLLRLSIHQNGQNMVPVMGFKEISDLLLTPFGLGKIRRTDHDQIFGMVQSIGDRIRKARGRRQLVFVPEDHAKFLSSRMFPQFFGDHVALNGFLNLFRGFFIQVFMPVTDKSDIFPLQ